MRDGRVEPRRRDVYVKQYVDRLSGEPARRQACRSGVSAGAVEIFVNHAGSIEDHATVAEVLRGAASCRPAASPRLYCTSLVRR